MLKNYLKITLRNLLKMKAYLLVNIFGLSLGLACTILATVFLMDEHSFDNFHTKAEDIYRINKFYTNEVGVINKSAESSGMMGPQMAIDFPEVKSFTRFQPWFNTQVVSFGEKHIQEDKLAFADSSFFEIFDFEVLLGNPSEVLDETRSIVLTKSLSEKLFGTENPIGSQLDIFSTTFQVTGVVEDSPRNSHMQFNALISWTSTLPGEGNLNFSFLNNWLAQVTNTYLLLTPNANIVAMEGRMVDMMATNFSERVDDYKLYLQHFKDIYLGSDDIQVGNFNLRLGSSSFVTIFNFIAVFVLLIAAVNYINISTSKAMRRAREVGVRKVLGAHKGQLFGQFVGEALFITTLSGILAVLIVDLSIPYFNSITGKFLESAQIFERTTLGLILLIILITSFVSGAYPALFLSAFKPAAVLKSGKISSLKGGALRKGMIVFQFFLATLMVASALVVYDQNEYLLKKDVGLDTEQVMIMELNEELSAKIVALRQEVEKHPDVLMTSASPAAIGGGTFGTTVIPKGFTEEMDIRFFRVDYNFIDVYGINIIEGRGFSKEFATDAGSVIVNQAFLNQVGWESIEGQTLQFSGSSDLPIIGLTEDFNYRALSTNAVEPMVMFINEYPNHLAIKISGDVSAVIDHVKEVHASLEEKYPFDYYFINDWFARQYSAEQNFLKIVTIFSILCISISCLGLYGLVSYFIEQRVKEIGIRKVLGASVKGISLMINGHFFKLILMSFLVSIPLSFYLMSRWLEDFAYRIDLGVRPFLLAALLTTVIALLTTFRQAIMASKRNPIQSLRYE
ncbi:ABC transporter permease [Roseivirga sp. E12]|uniref:ABC transporter permease n=1 Tax=Roseivirga sp. E12 TaxID=2819237 RepID=UPI001ABCEB40|nr:ABC transporter permease [Roseivirga sp. E12]MBO3697435.1 ABC transporter permease [Roseivirga sp. E12]